MVRKTVTWIVIADGEKARIVANDGVGKGLSAVPGHALATTLHADREIYADRPGRVQESVGAARHAKPPASRSDSAEIYVVAMGFRGQA